MPESWTSACSLLSPSLPSDQPIAIVSGAPSPLGAPLAMSRLGNELVRAPAIPSNEIDRTPSNCPTSVTSATTFALPKLLPPSVEIAIRNTLCFLTVSSQTA